MWELLIVFGRLGATAFGGPAAHIALMEQEFVRRRQWLSREEFLDFIGAANLLPGPTSTEVALHIGYRRAGLAGLMVAGIGFVTPAAVAAWVLALVYLRAGSLPALRHVLDGIAPVVVAIVAHAVVLLAPAAITSPWLLVIAVGCAAAAVAGMPELYVLLAGGLLSGGADLVRWWLSRSRTNLIAVAPMLLATSLAPPLAILPVFLKLGALVFGSGYVLFAFLHGDLVEQRGWLTEQQLLDAIAVGQMTPGPVFATATFIGQLVGGGWGAVAATVGIFAPAFVFVALSGPLVRGVRRSAMAGAMLDGVNAAALALIGVVCWQIARASVDSVPSVLLVLLSAWAIGWGRINPAWCLLAGAIAGLLMLT